MHFIHTDHLGTPLVMTSSGLASIEWSALYRPFGELRSITGTKSLGLRFPGQLFDPETGYHRNFIATTTPRIGR